MTTFSCSLCGAVWQKTGATNCWSSDPGKGPAKPAYCPTRDNEAVTRECFDLYRGDSQDAKMAKVAAKVEGLCYQPYPAAMRSMRGGRASKTR